MAQILGVQRKAARGAFAALRDAAIVETTRGEMTILDRPALEARACECYEPSRSVRDVRQAPQLACRLTASGRG